MTALTENGQLRVILSETETVKYNIDEVFFYGEKKYMQTALLLIFKAAAAKVGFKASSSKIAIEIYPIFEGGCEIWFIPQTATLKLSAVAKRANDKILAEFKSSERLFSAIELLYRAPEMDGGESVLYEKNEKYRLELRPKVGAQSVKTRLKETFADDIFTDPLSFAVTHEHWRILSGNAVGEIGKIINL